MRNYALIAIPIAAALTAGAGSGALSSQGGNSRTPRAAQASASAYVASATGLATGAVKDRGSASARGNAADRARTSVKIGDRTAIVKRGRTDAQSAILDGVGHAVATASTGKVSLAGGLVTVKSAAVVIDAKQDRRKATGRISSLVVNGRSLGTKKLSHLYRIPGIGRVKVLSPVNRGVAALHLHLTADYENIPAGSDIFVGVARATALDEVKPPESKTTTGPKSKTNTTAERSRKAAQAREKKRKVKAPLTGKGYVFPVYGKTRWSDTYGAARADTGSHEGDDIFGQFGAPVLAVHDGSLNRVGTLPISGNRLWLKTASDHTFFYAHLSAFSAKARNGARVKAGDVLGYVGSTGDAETTPNHLHFEVHPGDGDAVDPTPFLSAWQGHQDIPSSTWLTLYGKNPGAQPGQLIQVKDFVAGT